MDQPKPGVEQEVELIKRVQRGEQEPFSFLVERHQRRVFSIIYHLVRRRDEVEDIAQEIFFKAFQAIRSYNFESSFATWLSRVAVNHCYDYLRRVRSSRVHYFWEVADEIRLQLEARAERLVGEDLDPEEQSALKDIAGKLLDRAPADDRVVLVLKELEDLSVEEIAEILQLNVSTVKVRLHRARKRMLQDVKKLREGR
ncbi:MAG TPA: sigma-70 family RNA polymerase sigma factor [Terriglobia bacterium]|nr:sigma-70 family RNA polymerase sigma factor [Terriglobia bacterium]